MGNKVKDPRIKLIWWSIVAFFVLFIIPFLYFNLKSQKIENIIFAGVVAIMVYILMKLLRRKKKEIAFKSVVLGGYLFSSLCFFFALFFSFGIFIFDYIEKGFPPSLESLLIILVLIFFSVILFYFSNKSRRYEKKILQKNNINYSVLFYIYLAFILLFLLILLILRYIL